MKQAVPGSIARMRKSFVLILVVGPALFLMITLMFSHSSTIYGHLSGNDRLLSFRETSKAKLLLNQSEMQSWYAKALFRSDVITNLTSWDFRSKVRCQEIDFNKYPQDREQLFFYCDPKPIILSRMTNLSSEVMSVDFGDSCLKKVIEIECSDEMPVPNVVQYVWYGDNDISFFHFLSFLSTVRFMRPCLMLFQGENLPKGKYWDFFTRVYPRVVHVKRKLVQEIYGQKLAFKEHGADVMRIEGLQEYGGVYLDIDEILLRPIDNLRKYRCTLGQAIKNAFSISVIMAERNATFLNLWHEGYKQYSNNWAANSLFYPYKIYQTHPDLLHVEGFNFTRPSFTQLKLIFDTNYDWSTNYGMHYYVRFYKKPFNETIVRYLNTTLGAVSRHILFGNKELCLYSELQT